MANADIDVELQSKIDRHLDRLDAKGSITLHDYQRSGVHWMTKHKMGLIADEPGLGKTCMTLAWVSMEIRKTTHTRILIVTPLILKSQWIYENTLHAKVPIHVVTNLTGASNANTKVTLCTYGQLRKNQVLLERNWSTVIFDEAHVMSPETVMMRKASQMRGAKFLITATPLLNKLKEYTELLCLAGYTDLLTHEGVLPEIVLRRTREVLPALPELHIHTRLLTPHETEAPLHMTLLNNFLRRRPTNSTEFVHARTLGLCASRSSICAGILGIQSAEGILTSVTKSVRKRLNAHRWDVETAREDYLNAINAPPAQIQEQPQINNPLINENGQSAKKDAIETDLRAVLGTGRRTLIFFRFREQCMALLDLLEEIGVPRLDIGVIEGSVSAKMRTAILVSPPTVLLLQIKVGSCGMNLSMYSIVFMACLGWTDGEARQALERAHRQGQLNETHVFLYRLKNSMDAPMAVARKRKRELAETYGLGFSKRIAL